MKNSHFNRTLLYNFHMGQEKGILKVALQIRELWFYGSCLNSTVAYCEAKKINKTQYHVLIPKLVWCVVPHFSFPFSYFHHGNYHTMLAASAKFFCYSLEPLVCSHTISGALYGITAYNFLLSNILAIMIKSFQICTQKIVTTNNNYF